MEVSLAEHARKERREQCMKSSCCVVMSALLASGLIQLAVQSGAAPAEPDVPPATAYAAACSAHQQCATQSGDCCPTSNGVLMSCCDAIASSAKVAPFSGMCYAPTPAKNITVLPTDDYMADWAQPLWSGRQDLKAIAQMGFKVLRLYGNDPRLSHGDFLSYCQGLGLKVVVAISDFPYTQDSEKKCATAAPYDCFSEVRQQFGKMLSNGFTVRDVKGGVRYHPAIEAVILLNEPELKISYQGQIAGQAWSQGYYTKALLSALDGALSAEQQLQVAGRKPPFTVVHSFSTCTLCKSQTAGNTAGGAQVGSLAALGFMYDFVLGALRPESLGYSAKNDLKAALQNRYMLGFNTQDTSDVICKQVLEPLKKSPLAGLPIWAGEYKAWYQSLPESDVKDFKKDFQLLHGWLGSATCGGDGVEMRGVSIFEFQVSYYKGPGDHQMSFGIFELGSRQIGSTKKAEETQWKDFPVWCRRQRRNNKGQSWASAAAEVCGGHVPDDSSCPALFES